VSGAKVLLNGNYKDKVLATDPKTGKTTAEPVIAAFGGTNYTGPDPDHRRHRRATRPPYRRDLATEHHKFWNETKHTWTTEGLLERDRCPGFGRMRGDQGRVDVDHDPPREPFPGHDQPREPTRPQPQQRPHVPADPRPRPGDLGQQTSSTPARVRLIVEFEAGAPNTTA
jgi:hypothetical protein